MVKHIHKYKRVDRGRKGKPFFVMQCQLPGCNHYTAMQTKMSAPALVGKIGLCNKCEEPFELTRSSLRLAFPTCDCKNNPNTIPEIIESINTEEIIQAEEFFKELERKLDV